VADICTLDGVGVCVLEATALESLTVISVDDDFVVEDGLGCVVVERDSDDLRTARRAVVRVRAPVRVSVGTVMTFTTGIPTVGVICASVVSRAELEDAESDSESVTTVASTALLSTALALSLASAAESKLCGGADSSS
jgi:hypothetical protein